jgi:hypothetical protein
MGRPNDALKSVGGPKSVEYLGEIVEVVSSDHIVDGPINCVLAARCCAWIFEVHPQRVCLQTASGLVIERASSDEYNAVVLASSELISFPLVVPCQPARSVRSGIVQCMMPRAVLFMVANHGLVEG